MFQIRQTDTFAAWLSKLRDARAVARILARIESARLGNLGDVKSLGGKVKELRVHEGPGYRVYFCQMGSVVILLLCGGAKSTQALGHRSCQAHGQGIGDLSVMTKITEFDPSIFLTNDEVVAEYLTAALEDPNPDVFLAAVGNVAKARGMSAIAQNSGLGRESLYKALTPGAKPRYDTVLKVLQSLGVKISVSAA
jgi:probable addiction module antidote protein/putative addiction module killer protein